MARLTYYENNDIRIVMDYDIGWAAQATLEVKNSELESVKIEGYGVIQLGEGGFEYYSDEVIIATPTKPASFLIGRSDKPLDNKKEYMFNTSYRFFYEGVWSDFFGIGFSFNTSGRYSLTELAPTPTISEEVTSLFDTFYFTIKIGGATSGYLDENGQTVIQYHKLNYTLDLRITDYMDNLIYSDTFDMFHEYETSIPVSVGGMTRGLVKIHITTRSKETSYDQFNNPYHHSAEAEAYRLHLFHFRSITDPFKKSYSLSAEEWNAFTAELRGKGYLIADYTTVSPGDRFSPTEGEPCVLNEPITAYFGQHGHYYSNTYGELTPISRTVSTPQTSNPNSIRKFFSQLEEMLNGFIKNNYMSYFP